MAGILVIGGTGFIGKHLIKRLAKNKKYRIRCLVRKTTKKSNIQFLKSHGIEIFYGDLRDPKSLKGIDKDMDIVFYLAGGGDVASLSNRDYMQLKDYNLGTLKNFLKIINNIKKIIFFSSISSIGVQIEKVIDEDTPCKPTIPHEKCKFQAENLIKKYARIKKYHYSILRPSIVYGEWGFGDSYKMFKMISKRLFLMPGNGKNITPWVYVGNVVEAAIILMKKGKDEAYIINNEERVSFNEIIIFVSKLLNKKVHIIHVPLFLLKPTVYILEKICLALGISPPINLYRLKSMTSNRLYSIKKIKNLGYKQKVNFWEGMRRTIEWYKKNGYL